MRSIRMQWNIAWVSLQFCREIREKLLPSRLMLAEKEETRKW
jgi:hypothetical protein